MTTSADLFSRIKNARQQNRDVRQMLLKRKKYGGVVEIGEDGSVMRIKEADLEKMGQDTHTATEEISLVKTNETTQIKNSQFCVFVPFTKLKKRNGKLVVQGIASRQEIDAHGDIMMIDAIEAALPAYLEFGNIREMHQLSAVGKVTDHKIMDELKALWIEAEIIDPVAVSKVESGVYKGFSVGGSILDVEPLEGSAPNGMPLRWAITEIDLDEISLVDRPASPSSLIEMIKAAKRMKSPEMSFVFKAPTKAALTKISSTPNMGGSLQVQKNVKALIPTSLLSTPRVMDEKALLEKAVNSALKDMASNGFDLTKMEGKRELDASDIANLIQIGVQHGFALSKSDDGTTGTEETEEEEVTVEEETEETTEESVETEGTSEDGTATEETTTEETTEESAATEEEATEEQAEPLQKGKKTKPKMKKSAASPDLAKALSQLAASIETGFSSLRSDLKKASSGQSSQTTEELRKRKEEDEASFKGVFL